MRHEAAAAAGERAESNRGPRTYIALLPESRATLVAQKWRKGGDALSRNGGRNDDKGNRSSSKKAEPVHACILYIWDPVSLMWA